MDNSYRFFNNRDCKYFPCHGAVKEDEFNCLFCFCPLYMLEDRCGGNFRYYGKIKDCSECTIPHHPAGYDHIVARIRQYNEEKKGTEEESKVPEQE